MGKHGMGKYVENSRPFLPQYAWYGFQDMESTLIYPESEMMDGRFWPCAGGVSLYLSPMTEERPGKIKNAGIPVVESTALSGADIVSLSAPPFIFHFNQSS